MSLHGILILGSVFFCVGTIVQSRNVPIWKSHSLATMSQGHTIIDFGPEAKSVEELEKRAESIEVSLATDEKSQLLRWRHDSTPAQDENTSRQVDEGAITTGRQSPV